MVRTRRQAAQQPETAINAQPTALSSGDESDIPAATRSRSRRDPHSIATLRPSRGQRPELFLRTSKRNATTAQLVIDSLSKANNSRKGSVITSSAPKRRKVSARDEVNPASIHALNDFSKKARGTRDAPARRLHSITVELKQTSARSSVARTLPEAREDDDVEAEEQPQEQPEEGVGSERPSDPATTAEAEAEQSHAQLPHIEHIRTSEHDTSDLPPRSRQGGVAPAVSQREPPSQRLPRKSKPRKPKTAFEERPLVEEPPRRVSKPASSVLRTSERPQAATTATAIPPDPLKQVFAYDLPSSGRTSTEDSIVIEDSGPEDGESDDGLEKPSGNDDAGDRHLHQVPPTTETQLTVHVRSKEIRSMCTLMGREGWTAHRKDWAKNVSDPATLENGGHPVTSFGRKICKLVLSLQELYESAPRAPQIARQNAFLQEKKETTEKAIAAITQIVDNIYKKYYAHVQGDDSGIEMRLTDALTKDMTQYIIPFLVLLFREFFFLGGNSLDTKDNPELPVKGGDFSSTTLRLLLRTVGWIYRLAPIIKRETELDKYSSEEEGGHPKSTATEKSGERQIFEKRVNRIALYDIARDSLRTIAQALAELDELVNREARRKAKMERAEELKAEKEQEAREARLKSQKRWEAMCASTQRLRDGIGPVSNMWVEAQQLEMKRAAERQRELAERERMGSPQLGGFFDESPVRDARHGRSAAALFSPQDRPVATAEDSVPTAKKWTTVESQWLLGKLKEGLQPEYNSWAEALGRRVDEVRQEAHLLKVSARSLARDKGRKVPAWAQD
ncbi:hypothetical protein BR93DRAFT_930454 [Coniochaeta sp. PMI_546]|nr:hypothetical protein BR93DRAFT_930454 [Coniochaeta sp. PMI_546]